MYKEDQNMCLKEYSNSYFLSTFSFNVDNFINFVHRLLKLCMAILDMVMEGTVSQIFYLGSSFHFM